MNKQIHIYYINKIKDCLRKIYNAEDDGIPNRRIVVANENAIDKYLNKAGIINKKLRQELLANITWSNDNCKEKLEKLGWKILTGKEELEKMTSKEALELAILDSEKDLEEDENNQWVKNVLKGLKECQKDLERLEKLEKVIDFLKLNFDISLDSKLRISDGSECVQTFITYLPENTTIDEMFKALREVVECQKD